MNLTKFTQAIVMATLLGSASIATAQNGQDDRNRPQADRSIVSPQDVRTRMLRQLGLTPQQVQRLRRVNAERRPQMDAAQKRVRDANKALDDAIYADQINESDIHARLKDMQTAQAEVLRLRFMNELAVRKVLTPEQLTRFRMMRERFERSGRPPSDRRGSIMGPAMRPDIRSY